MPPGEWETSPWEQLRLLPAMGAAFRRYLPRVIRAIAALEANHPHERHWYLPFIGVRPDRQGNGIGSALLAHMEARLDAEGLPAYLEASSERNRALYVRHGFDVTGEVRLPDGPPMWLMWREPKEA